MKLNTRLWILVLPVIIFSAILFTYFIYSLQKDSLLRSEKARLIQYGTQLSFLVGSYNSFAEAYFEPFLQSDAFKSVLSSEDEALLSYSIENNLTEMLKGVSTIKVDKFTLAVLLKDGTEKYFFEDSEDPFSEPGDIIYNFSLRMHEEKKVRERKIITGFPFTSIVHAKAIDPVTLREPVAHRWDEAVTVIVYFGMIYFDQLINDLNEEGYLISIFNSEDGITDYDKYSLEMTGPLVEGYWFHIEYDEDLVAKDLNRLLSGIFLGSSLAVVIVTFLLVLLIERNVTYPIIRLQRNVMKVDKGNDLPEPSQAKDEVSSLERSFYQLYDQLKTSYSSIKALAETDPLTHLMNRRQFTNVLDRILSRIDKDKKVALLFIDLDNFKFVNDNFGHDVGDRLLIEFSERLRQHFRPSDTVLSFTNVISRLAGDEFCVLLHDLQCETTVQKAASRVVEIFDGGFDTDDGTFPVSASIGIAVYPRDGKDSQELMVNADASMYQAKTAGKNQFSFYSKELAEKNQRFTQVEVALKVVDYSEFNILYMPQVDMVSEEVHGVEALIRWHSPSLGFVSPNEFIPIAESSGVFRTLDFWIIRKVLSDRPRLSSILGEDVRISINISAAQLNSGSFFLDVMLILKDLNESARNIVLEITETFAAGMSDTLISNLNLLKQAGFELALDDFGTGYSSIVQLLDYPIDEVKIDKYMIDRIQDGDGGLVKSLSTLFKSFGYRVTAEGVETPEQVALLNTMDIDTLQGYYYSKPVTIEVLANTMKAPGVKQS